MKKIRAASGIINKPHLVPVWREQLTGPTSGRHQPHHPEDGEDQQEGDGDGHALPLVRPGDGLHGQPDVVTPTLKGRKIFFLTILKR